MATPIKVTHNEFGQEELQIGSFPNIDCSYYNPNEKLVWGDILTGITSYKLSTGYISGTIIVVVAGKGIYSTRGPCGGATKITTVESLRKWLSPPKKGKMTTMEQRVAVMFGFNQIPDHVTGITIRQVGEGRTI